MRAVARPREEVPDAELIATPGYLSIDEGTVQALKILPDVDILVNNLGTFGEQPALEISDEEWRRFFEVNVLTAVTLTRHYLPRMMDAG